MSDELRDTLEQVHLELLKLPALPPEEQEKIDALAAHVRSRIDNPDAELEDDAHISFNELVQDSAARFETEHPTLSALLSRVLETLQSIGI